MAKRYYWLKLQDGFFDSKRIKKLRKIAGGDTYTIIYLKMQLKALKTDGVLTFDHVENTFAEELALDINEEPENVQVTLNFLISHGMVDTSDNVSFFLPYVVQNTGSEGSSAQRMREMRAKQAPPQLPEAPKVSQCDSSVTERREREEKEKIESRSELEGKGCGGNLYGVFENVPLTPEQYMRFQSWNNFFPVLDQLSMDIHNGERIEDPALRLSSMLVEDHYGRRT